MVETGVQQSECDYVHMFIRLGDAASTFRPSHLDTAAANSVKHR